MSPTEYQELVAFIGRRFDTIADRFDGVDRRFDALHAHLDERFREVYGHFDEIYRRLERLEQEYYAITESLRRIEAILADERVRRDALDRDLTELRRRVGDLESRMDQIQRRLPS
jgi:chromosome segregation ATPase